MLALLCSLFLTNIRVFSCMQYEGEQVTDEIQSIANTVDARLFSPQSFRGGGV